MNTIPKDFPFDLSSFAFVFKYGYIIGLLTYVVFALVVIKQVQQMTMAVNGPLTPVLKLVSYLHFAVALLVLGMAIIVL